MYFNMHQVFFLSTTGIYEKKKMYPMVLIYIYIFLCEVIKNSIRSNLKIQDKWKI